MKLSNAYIPVFQIRLVFVELKLRIVRVVFDIISLENVLTAIVAANNANFEDMSSTCTFSCIPFSAKWYVQILCHVVWTKEDFPRTARWCEAKKQSFEHFGASACLVDGGLLAEHAAYLVSPSCSENDVSQKLDLVEVICKIFPKDNLFVVLSEY